MKLEIFIALLSFGISVQGQLNCYVCENCEDFTNKTLLYCGPTTSTEGTTPTTTLGVETTSTIDDETTTTEAIEGTTINTDEPPKEPENRIHNYRSVLRQRRDTSKIVYSCYSITIKGVEGSKSQVNRGCLAIPNGENGCAVYLNQTGVNPDKIENCRFCQNDGCNSSAVARLSVLAILFIFVLQFLL